MAGKSDQMPGRGRLSSGGGDRRPLGDPYADRSADGDSDADRRADSNSRNRRVGPGRGFGDSHGTAWKCEAASPGFAGFSPYDAVSSPTREIVVGFGRPGGANGGAVWSWPLTTP